MVVSVSTFISRLEGLAEDENDAPWPDGSAARELLAERGLTSACVEQATVVLERLGKVKPAPVTDVEQEIARRQKAEEVMWGWYLEWSTIAQQGVDTVMTPDQ